MRGSICHIQLCTISGTHKVGDFLIDDALVRIDDNEGD